MARLQINEKKKLGRIEPEVYGHFSEHLGRCIYEGLYVGEESDIENVNGMRTDVVEALRELQVPVLRWPGGCFADEYHWKDGIGDKKNRKKMINTHWGGVVEDNSFGTHEFMELCKQIGCKTYVNGNLGSGTVQEMSEWVEYMTFSGVSPMADLRRKNGHEEPWTVDYFGVGNENWGCGGNMTPEFYANEYRRYQTYVRNYDEEKKKKKIACGANTDEYYWTEGVMKTAFSHTPSRYHGFMDLIPRTSRKRAGTRPWSKRSSWRNSLIGTARSSISTIRKRRSAFLSTSGEPGSVWSPALIPDFCISRALCVTHWWRLSHSIFSTSTVTVSNSPASRRWSMFCRQSS